MDHELARVVVPHDPEAEGADDRDQLVGPRRVDDVQVPQRVDAGAARRVGSRRARPGEGGEGRGRGDQGDPAGGGVGEGGRAGGGEVGAGPGVGEAGRVEGRAGRSEAAVGVVERVVGRGRDQVDAEPAQLVRDRGRAPVPGERALGGAEDAGVVEVVQRYLQVRVGHVGGAQDLDGGQDVRIAAGRDAGVHDHVAGERKAVDAAHRVRPRGGPSAGRRGRRGRCRSSSAAG
jgi:hypothetical protein